jgi:hypothetical protein
MGHLKNSFSDNNFFIYWQFYFWRYLSVFGDPDNFGHSPDRHPGIPSNNFLYWQFCFWRYSLSGPGQLRTKSGQLRTRSGQLWTTPDNVRTTPDNSGQLRTTPDNSRQLRTTPDNSGQTSKAANNNKMAILLAIRHEGWVRHTILYARKRHNFYLSNWAK